MHTFVQAMQALGAASIQGWLLFRCGFYSNKYSNPQQGLSHQSINVYLSAVHILHLSMGLHEEFSKQLTPRLKLVLKGIKKEKARTVPPAGRLPVTTETMRSIKAVLDSNAAHYDNALLWATSCLAFFRF